MAKCSACGATTGLPRGRAAIELKWFFIDLAGSAATKYGVFCPDHKWGEIEPVLKSLAKQALGKAELAAVPS